MKNDVMSIEDWVIFWAAIKNPPTPTPEMITMAKEVMEWLK